MKRIALLMLLAALCVVLTGCTGLVRIEGQSMSPTLEDGDLTMTAPYASPEEIERFDVVICRYPGRGSALFAKRIVGLPGDTVAMKDGYLYVNSEKIDEPYLLDEQRAFADLAETVVPEGCYYVLGDNRRNSNDSRSPGVGTLPCDCIVREVVSVLWPESRPVE